MAFNLPPPWDPGFAIPDNVRNEGIQRQGFVTKQMPRGTYDQPAVGHGGYAVPQYVKDEGYGQGTFTSKWPPGGTSTMPPVPHWQNQRPRVMKETRLPGGGRRITITRHTSAQVGSPATHALSDAGGVGAGTLEQLLPVAAAAGLAYLLLRKKRR